MNKKGSNNYDQIKRTKAEKRALMVNQKIVFDENWTIQRADLLNWEILYKGKFHGYYGKFADAVHALPARMLDPQVQNTVGSVLNSLNAIHAMIDDRLKWDLRKLSPPA